MKRNLVKVLVSGLFAAVALTLALSGTFAQDPQVFWAVTGVRIHSGAQVAVGAFTVDSANVVAFQVFWAVDPTGTFEAMADPFPGSGLDGTAYFKHYDTLITSGPLYIKIVATMQDASTVESETILVQDQVTMPPFDPRGAMRGSPRDAF